MITITVEDEDEGYYHIEHPSPWIITLCGWCDVWPIKDHKNKKPNCPGCLKIVEFCKSVDEKEMK